MWVNTDLFWYRNYGFVCLTGFFFGFTFYAINFITPQYFIIGRGMDATSAGMLGTLGFGCHVTKD